MRKALILLIALIIFSCNNSTENDDPEIKLIGAVTFQMKRIAETGQVLGQYFQMDGIDGIKVELLSGTEIIATEYTKESDSLDCFFVFDNLDTDIEYRIKATLNENIYKITDPFTIDESDLQEQDRDSFVSTFGYVPDWFEKGTYYLGIMQNLNTNLRFNLYDNDIEFAILPQPVSNSGEIHFSLPEINNCLVEILTHKFENVMVLYSGILQAGNHAMVLDTDEIDNGFYLLHYSFADRNYYIPFSIIR